MGQFEFDEIMTPPEEIGTSEATSAKENGNVKDVQMDADTLEQAGSPQASGSAGTATSFELGRGLDVGTANLVSAVQGVDGNVSIKIQRNAFIDIDCDDYTRNMLTRLNVQYVVIDNRMVVVGDPAFELANIFNRETRRPMKDGLISPKEADAMPIEKMLLENLLGPPNQKDEICYFSVPGEPIRFARGP